MGVLTTLILRD